MWVVVVVVVVVVVAVAVAIAAEDRTEFGRSRILVCVYRVVLGNAWGY